MTLQDEQSAHLIPLPDAYVTRRGFYRIISREMALELLFIAFVIAVLILHVIQTRKRLRALEERLNRFPARP